MDKAELAHQAKARALRAPFGTDAELLAEMREAADRRAAGANRAPSRFLFPARRARRPLAEINVRGVARESQESDGHMVEIKRPWRAICALAGLSSVRVHDLRHSYASILASAGLSLPVIGALLGHTQPGTTSRYAHLFDDPLRAATERVGAIVDAGKKPAAEVVDITRGRG